MSRKPKGRLPPFVPLYKETMKTPAWRALTHGARSLYVHLKWRYNTNLQNHVFVSTRDAAKELGSQRDSVCAWFRELHHYGFTVMINPGGPGIDGHGKAPHWRLTEEWYLGKAPTRDFLIWDGTKFKDRPSRQRRWIRNKSISPGCKTGATLGVKPGPVAYLNIAKVGRGWE